MPDAEEPQCALEGKGLADQTEAQQAESKQASFFAVSLKARHG